MARSHNPVPFGKKLTNGLTLEVRKNRYDGLWNVVYADNGMKWAGPFKTRREAIEKMEDAE